VLFYDPAYYFSHPLRIFAIWEGGLASHGATIGILIGLYLFARKTKVAWLWIVDRLVIVSALTGAFIRLGNLMNSEMIGIPTMFPGLLYLHVLMMYPVIRHNFTKHFIVSSSSSSSSIYGVRSPHKPRTDFSLDYF